MCLTPWSFSARMTISEPVSSCAEGGFPDAATSVFRFVIDRLSFVLEFQTIPDSKQKGRYRPCMISAPICEAQQLRKRRGSMATRRRLMVPTLSSAKFTLFALQQSVKKFHESSLR